MSNLWRTSLLPWLVLLALVSTVQAETSQSELATLAAAGDGRASHQLALIAFSKNEPLEGLHHLEMASTQGDAASQSHLREYFRAVRYRETPAHADAVLTSRLRQAQSANPGWAPVTLGLYYESGELGRANPPNHRKAFDWYLVAANAGNAFAMGRVVSKVFLMSHLGSDERKEILQRFEPQIVARGDPLLLYDEGLLKRNSREEEEKKAGYAAIRRAAEKGMPLAIDLYTVWACEGLSGESAAADCEAWLRLAEQANRPHARLQLERKYLHNTRGEMWAACKQVEALARSALLEQKIPVAPMLRQNMSECVWTWGYVPALSVRSAVRADSWRGAGDLSEHDHRSISRIEVVPEDGQPDLQGRRVNNHEAINGLISPQARLEKFGIERDCEVMRSRMLDEKSPDYIKTAADIQRIEPCLQAYAQKVAAVAARPTRGVEALLTARERAAAQANFVRALEEEKQWVVSVVPDLQHMLRVRGRDIFDQKGKEAQWEREARPVQGGSFSSMVLKSFREAAASTKFTAPVQPALSPSMAEAERRVGAASAKLSSPEAGAAPGGAGAAGTAPAGAAKADAAQPGRNPVRTAGANEPEAQRKAEVASALRNVKQEAARPDKSSGSTTGSSSTTGSVGWTAPQIFLTTNDSDKIAAAKAAREAEVATRERNRADAAAALDYKNKKDADAAAEAKKPKPAPCVSTGHGACGVGK